MINQITSHCPLSAGRGKKLRGSENMKAVATCLRMTSSQHPSETYLDTGANSHRNKKVFFILKISGV